MVEGMLDWGDRRTAVLLREGKWVGEVGMAIVQGWWSTVKTDG